MSRQRILACVFVAICASYANHFHNSFHFDDSHTIVDNQSIRTLKNAPAFFTDATTFSVLPTNRAYRPMVPLSLAVDYQLGHGLSPVAFHISTLFWFLVLVWVVFRFAQRLFDGARPGADNTVPAGLAAAWYGLHPVCAETVNYIIQRGDLYATLGVTAAIYLYAARPGWRRFGVYLLPAAAALLSKPPAMVFPFLLLGYIVLFEKRSFQQAAREAAPSVVVTGVLLALISALTPAQFNPGAYSPFLYRVTQPYVAWRYFTSFLLPIQLSADTDLGPFADMGDPRVLGGFLFLGVVAAAAWWCCRRRETAPIGFGLIWFLVALAPTSLFALAEVENDHRMFFPFIGLTISLIWTLALIAPRLVKASTAAAAAVVVLCGFAWGTHVRNEVWLNEGTLWHDVTVKSPRNGRGLMNYGLTLMSAGNYPSALDYMRRAQQFTPNYHILEINLGIVLGQLGQDQEAEQHFRRAVILAPADSLPYHFYAGWLQARGRPLEALAHARRAVALNPSYGPSQVVLASLEQQAGPSRQVQQSRLVEAERQANSPESLLELSLAYHQAGRYSDCIRTAQEAIKRKPDFAEAYNNIAAAYEELEQWDEAIAAATRALQLKPGFVLARNNLAWSVAQKHRPKLSQR